MGPGPQAGSEPSAAALGGRRASGGLGESVWARAQSSPRFALQASGRRSPESGSKPEKILKRGTYDKVAGLGQGRQREGTPGPPELLGAATRPIKARRAVVLALGLRPPSSWGPELRWAP